MTTAEKAGAPVRKRKKSQIVSIWERYRKSKLAVFGLILLFLLVFFCGFANLFCDYETDAIGQNIMNKLQYPGNGHLFGTDQYGRDLFARILYGGRISLAVGLVVIIVSLIVGTILGAVAGYYGGAIDNIIMRVMDVFLAIPASLMTIAIVAALGSSIPNMLLAMSIAHVPQFARVVRSSVMSVRQSDYIEAARACGTKESRIIFRHILPNAIGPVIVYATLAMSKAILLIATLGFLGIGVPAPTPEWGTILAENRGNMRYFPYLVTIPGIAIVLAVLSLNLIGDGLRDALDPKLKN